MFLEPHFAARRSGWIEVICGSMFSGKTEELIRRLKRAKIAKLKVEIYKPFVDTRYDITKIVSHDSNFVLSTPVKQSRQILNHSEDVDVIGIDEAQCVDMEWVEGVEQLALKGKRIIIAGLDMDYKGQPFGPMPHLLSVAEYITKVHAICVDCGDLAQHSFRFTESEDLVLVGEKESYKPLCRKCYNQKQTDRKSANLENEFDQS